MRISDVMTPDVRAIAPDRTVRDAARLMDELNVGVLPVCLDGRLLGIITDRDITVRSTAVGAAPGEQAVQEIMTSDLTSCVPDDEVADVLRRMSALQVRRMPVIDAVGRLVGIVSLGDLAADGAPGTDAALRRISTPAEPDRSGTPSTARADATRDHRPLPLSNEEQRELDRRLSQPPGPRPDEGRTPDNPGGSRSGGLVFSDEDNIRAASGSFGNAASGGGTGHMPGGFGGDDYTHYGETFGPGEDAGAVPLTDVGDLGRPDDALDGPAGAEGGGPSTSAAPAADDGRASRVVFSSGSRDPGSGGTDADESGERG
jgi:CBS domain-containing protein